MTLDSTSVEFPNIMVSCGAKPPLVYGLLSIGPAESWMRPTFKRLEVKDLGNLEKLVADNIEGIEPGLRVVDSRLVLGQAAIDLVALDASESLVLIALDFMADEGLLLRAMDAYSWCLEYPDTLRRLYPMANVSFARPPRILFIVERLTDAFVRRIKHLSFLEIDCLEFRHLEVNGASAVYFDLVERLRRAAPIEPAPDERVITTTPVRTPKRIDPEPPIFRPASPVLEPTVEQPSPPSPVLEPTPFVPAEPTPESITAASAVHERIVSLETRLAELLAEASAAPTASPAETTSAAKMSFAVEMPSLESLFTAELPPAGETSSAEEMPTAFEMPAEEHATEEEPAAASADVDPEVGAEEPALEFEPVGDTDQEEVREAPSVAARVAANPDWQALLSQLGVEIPAPPRGTKAESTERASETPPPVNMGMAAVAEVASAVEETVPAVEEAGPSPVEPTAPERTLPAWAKPSANRVGQPVGGRTYFFSQAAKGPTPADAPAATPVAAPAQPATAPSYLRPAATAQRSVWPPAPPAAQIAVPGSQPAPASAPKPLEPATDRPELEALHFPKDGLSRQWLEFLNQLGGTQ